jgi:hypothetical protein
LSARRLTVALVLALVAVGCSGKQAPLDTAEPLGTASPPARSATPSGPRDFGIEKLSAESSGSANCGEYAIAWRSPDNGGSGGPAATLTAISGKKVVLDVKGSDEFEQIWALWCGDVTADGRPELGFQRYTGGAHCCSRARVDTLDGPTLLDVDLGNAGDPEPEQLDGSGAYELVTYNDALAYFEDLPYAVSPMLPRVFAFKNDHFVDATGDFPQHVRKSLEDARKDLASAIARKEDTVGLEGLALGVFGHYVLIGQEESGLDDVATSVPDDVAQWLRDHAEAAIALIRGD